MQAERWQWMREELETLKRQSQYRSLQASRAEQPGWMIRSGKRMLNLASNDYLGLAQTRETKGLADADRDAEFHSGSGASRLIAGNDPLYTRFEARFAEFKQTQSCLIFSSGYMANIGAIAALAGRGDAVFSDRLNHASIVDGIVLSRADHLRYRHNDMNYLEALLKKASTARRKLIVTDAVFSMDGDKALLSDLITLKNRYDALLMIDEAHSGGVFSEKGEGLAHSLGLSAQIDVQMGTFSKAYGSYGAYIAGDAVLIDYLINKSRSFIYTTALPAYLVQVTEQNWQMSIEQSWRRERLAALSAWFRGELGNAGFDTGLSETQIVPVVVGSNVQAMVFSERLQRAGLAAVAVRPPTVPEGQARIRFSLMAVHEQEDLQWAVEEIRRAGKELNLI